MCVCVSMYIYVYICIYIYVSMYICIYKYTAHTKNVTKSPQATKARTYLRTRASPQTSNAGGIPGVWWSLELDEGNFAGDSIVDVEKGFRINSVFQWLPSEVPFDHSPSLINPIWDGWIPFHAVH